MHHCKTCVLVYSYCQYKYGHRSDIILENQNIQINVLQQKSWINQPDCAIIVCNHCIIFIAKSWWATTDECITCTFSAFNPWREVVCCDKLKALLKQVKLCNSMFWLTGYDIYTLMAFVYVLFFLWPCLVTLSLSNLARYRVVSRLLGALPGDFTQ